MSDQAHSDTASDAHGFTVILEQEHDYAFRVQFDADTVPDLYTDEEPPLGQGTGPNPARLLAAAVGNCLSASLLFCLSKSRVAGARVRSEVHTQVARNDQGRWRIQGLDVRIQLSGVSEQQRARVDRCLGLFEDFCIVTESVRQGVPVRVQVVQQ